MVLKNEDFYLLLSTSYESFNCLVKNSFWIQIQSQKKHIVQKIKSIIAFF